jgi:hypothetical protein
MRTINDRRTIQEIAQIDKALHRTAENLDVPTPMQAPLGLVAIGPTTLDPRIAVLAPRVTRVAPTANPIRTVVPIRAKVTPRTAKDVPIGK